MDGKWVPNWSLNFNFKLEEEFSYQTHLMVKDPEKEIERSKEKIKTIIFHKETVDKNKTRFLIRKIKNKKKEVGIALNPGTSVREIKEFLPEIKYILIMTVQPGFYGSKFLISPLKKIFLIKKFNPQIKVIVDGGMNPETIKKAKKAGAELFVSGSYIVKAENPKERLGKLLKSLK